jgi:putative Mg2+ transporter-C (MgtC) family protein
LAVGVTTAATIWFVTVMGLCFGGGQLELGLAGFALGFLVLTGLKKFEIRMPRRHSATLRISVSPGGPNQSAIATLLKVGGLSLTEPALCVEASPTENQVYSWKVEWKGQHEDTNLPEAIQKLAADRSIQKLEVTR